MIKTGWYKISVWFSNIFNIFLRYFIRFAQMNPSGAAKVFNLFLAGINFNQFWNIPEEKDFAVLRILNLFIKSFGNPFVDIALFDSSFNIFLFDVKFFS